MWANSATMHSSAPIGRGVATDLPPTISSQPLGCFLSEARRILVDRGLHLVFQLGGLGADSCPVAALGCCAGTFHLTAAVEQVDDVFGVLLGDGSNFVSGRINRLAVLQPEVPRLDRCGERTGRRELPAWLRRFARAGAILRGSAQDGASVRDVAARSISTGMPAWCAQMNRLKAWAASGPKAFS